MADAGRVELRLRIRLGDAIAMGPGKADLLDAIDAAGSISAAARLLGMSYRRAWLLVEEMNRCFNVPLVETRPGAGAQLSDPARAVLAAYRASDAAAAAATAKAAAPIIAALRSGRPDDQ
ncbi:winged helix-turn-helix domain-containing protein [Sphingopyxis sp.]|jgi:molybdate transport system regulatory protein|uniref:winged helix-turn-helix domain-containing protein n=1 Tax=Sphingopyxis sp. TaxID=1908224 RepID=UPI003F6F54BD